MFYIILYKLDIENTADLGDEHRFKQLTTSSSRLAALGSDISSLTLYYSPLLLSTITILM